MSIRQGSASQVGAAFNEAAADLGRLLQLVHPPVGVAFLAQPPAGVPVRTTVAPSACTLWRDGERETFYVTDAGHLGCAVGAVVLGMPLDDDARQRLGQTVAQMAGSGYLDADEPAHLPTRTGGEGGVLYGPLATLPVAPDLVLTWLTPRGAMLLAEAAEAVRWTGRAGLTLTGRPACAALPLAESSGSVAASLGCTGMRHFTGITDDLLLAVLPGPQLGACVAALSATAESNEQMAAFYAGELDR